MQRISRLAGHLHALPSSSDSSNESPAVLLDVRPDGVALLTLNRPHNRNSMTRELLSAFRSCIAQVKAIPEVRCVVIAGSGSTFCAGADFKERGGG